MSRRLCPQKGRKRNYGKKEPHIMPEVGQKRNCGKKEPLIMPAKELKTKLR
jgi:hypothetical protein